MARISENLNRPIMIGGRKVVLIPELVGTVPIKEQHEYVELEPATNVCPALNVREVDIEQVRDNFPGVPVYGMWQTLIQSGIVSFQYMLQVIPINQWDGYYLYSEVGRANYSGIYEAGFFAADTSFNLEDAHVVEASLDQLVLPEREAKLAKEMLSERRNTVRAAWGSALSVVAGILFFAFTVDLVLKEIYAHQYQTLESKSELLADVKSGLQELRNTRLTEVPNNTATLEKLAALWAMDNKIKSVGSNKIGNKVLRFKTSEMTENPENYLSWVKAKPLPSGSWNITVRQEKR